MRKPFERFSRGAPGPVRGLDGRDASPLLLWNRKAQVVRLTSRSLPTSMAFVCAGCVSRSALPNCRAVPRQDYDYKILINEGVYQEVKEKIPCVDLGLARRRGKEDEVHI